MENDETQEFIRIAKAVRKLRELERYTPWLLPSELQPPLVEDSSSPSTR